MKDGGAVESHTMTHFGGNRWRFANMKTIFGNGPIGAFSSVAINDVNFGIRKKKKK